MWYVHAHVIQILDTFKDWQFFFGEKGVDGDGMLIFMNFRDDGITPYMLFFKDGLVEEKVVSDKLLGMSCTYNVLYRRIFEKLV